MSQSSRDALLIFNPLAGRARKFPAGALDRVGRTLAKQNIDTELALTATPEAAEETARSAAQGGRDLVIACGGDGTLNAIVNGFAGSKVPMALLPAGTANILAKELNLPRNVERAAEYVARGTLRRIALGMVTTEDGGICRRYFLSVGGAGPDGEMVQTVNEDLKRHGGTLAFWAEGVRQLALYKFPRFRVIAGEHRVDATMIVVGRTKHYGGPLRITTQANLFGAIFELMVCTTGSRLLYLAYVPLACTGQMRWAPKTCFFHGITTFRCEPLDSPAASLQVDGEPVERLPAEFCIVPDALTLVVPA